MDRTTLIHRGLLECLSLSAEVRTELFCFSPDEDGRRTFFEVMLDERTNRDDGFTEKEKKYVKKWIKNANRYIQTDDLFVDRNDENCFFTYPSKYFVQIPKNETTRPH